MMSRLVMSVVLLFASVFISSAWAGKNVDGKALFEAKCAGCHGAEGVGTGMLKPLKGSDFLSSATDANLRKIIVEGTNGGMIPMPPMKDELNKEEIGAIVEYIKSLK